MHTILFLLLSILLQARAIEKPLPKEGMIAHCLRDAKGQLQIFTINPDGSQKRQLTFEGQNGLAAWSRDGKKIVFMSIRGPSGAQIFTMNADGSNQKLVTDGAAPDWSPDGKQIACHKGHDIWLVNEDGSNARQLTHSDTFKARPNFSHDGKQIVFLLIQNPANPQGPKPQLGIMNVDGSGERQLTIEKRMNVNLVTKEVIETAFDANAPAFSPVDDRIAFWSGIENQYGQIWIINSNGSDSRQLTDDPRYRNSDDPSWSPDGKKILFSTGRNGKNELWVMNSDGTGQKRISDIDAGPFPGRASWQAVW
jgi:TolB protein